MNVDFTTEYLGLKLRSPLVVASCPLTAEVDVLKRIETLGAGAAVLPSMFEEQLGGKTACAQWSEFQGSTHDHHRQLMHYNQGPETYLKHIEHAKKEVKLPIIASLNGRTAGAWLDFARKIEAAGADALELNLMILPTDAQISGETIERQYVEAVEIVRGKTTLPLAVKLSPFFTALPNFVKRLAGEGVNGAVLFNRCLPPDLDIDLHKVLPKLEFSTHGELYMALRWIGALHGHVNLSLAATGGIGSGLDILKALAVGADVVQIASELYRSGIDRLTSLREECVRWMSQHEYGDVATLKGSLSHNRCADEAAFNRANYTRAIAMFAADVD